MTARRQFDIVMAWSVYRLGHSLQDLVGFLGDVHALGVDLFLHQQGLGTRTPVGKAMFQMSGVFPEFERSMIQERVRAGLRLAKLRRKSGVCFQGARRGGRDGELSSRVGWRWLFVGCPGLFNAT
jgi:DNA invertase Pin-like site-specific DNA recombinase